MAENYPGRLVLGLDAREGKVATQGWLETSRVDATTLAEQFEGLPLAGIIYTDIARDGTLEGPNLDATRALAERVKTPVIASGGVGCLADLHAWPGCPSPAASSVVLSMKGRSRWSRPSHTSRRFRSAATLGKPGQEVIVRPLRQHDASRLDSSPRQHNRRTGDQIP